MANILKCGASIDEFLDASGLSRPTVYAWHRKKKKRLAMLDAAMAIKMAENGSLGEQIDAFGKALEIMNEIQ